MFHIIPVLKIPVHATYFQRAIELERHFLNRFTLYGARQLFTAWNPEFKTVLDSLTWNDKCLGLQCFHNILSQSMRLFSRKGQDKATCYCKRYSEHVHGSNHIYSVIICRRDLVIPKNRTTNVDYIQVLSKS